MGFFIETLLSDPFTYISWVGVVAFSICFHEYAHASMAYKLGDDTAALLGHMSLNPMVQMGPSSLIMLLLFGIAWGSVPVNPRHIRGRSAQATVSLAGPASNLLLCLIFAGLAAGLAAFTGNAFGGSLIGQVLVTGAVANGVLCFFNMLPIPMLDGWAVFGLFIPQMKQMNPMQARNVSWIFIMLVFLTPLGGLVWGIGTFVANSIMIGWYRLFALFV